MGVLFNKRTCNQIIIHIDIDTVSVRFVSVSCVRRMNETNEMK